MTVRVSLLGSYGQSSSVSDVSTLWRHASPSTLYTHPIAADAGCQGNRTDNQPDKLEPTGGTECKESTEKGFEGTPLGVNGAPPRASPAPSHSRPASPSLAPRGRLPSPARVPPPRPLPPARVRAPPFLRSLSHDLFSGSCRPSSLQRERGKGGRGDSCRSARRMSHERVALKGTRCSTLARG
eukprot:1183818-Prorocentrum_minimum.AAC.3